MQESFVRFPLRLGAILSVPGDPFLRRSSQYAMIRKVHPSQEIHAGGECRQVYLFWVHRESQSITQKFLHARQ